MSPIPPRAPLRSVFISDVRVGLKGCRAGFLLDLHRRVECEQLYLVGDIIDLWSLERTFYSPQRRDDVIRTLLGKAGHGTRVVYCNDVDWVERCAAPLMLLAPGHAA